MKCLQVKMPTEKCLQVKCLMLSHAVGGVGSSTGDRLEPSAQLEDVMDFDLLVPPYLVLFWRIPETPSVHRRHPLLNPELYIGLESFSVDMLHTLHLGVFQYWCARALWDLFAVDAFNTRAERRSDVVRISLGLLVAKLRDWYPVYQRSLSENAARAMTQVQRIRPGMVGTHDAPSCKLKGSETRHFLPFLLLTLQEHSEALRSRDGDCNYDALVQSGQCLLAYMDVLARESRRVSEQGAEELTRLCNMHIELAKQARVDVRPKHHLWRHMTARVPALGNPRMYATFHDESINRMLAEMAFACHRMTFERRLFARFGWNQTRTEHVSNDTWW